MKAVGQKAGQSVTGSPMPYQTNTRLVEKKAQDAGPDSDDEFDDEDEPGEPSHKPGFEETGGASSGGGQPPPKDNENDFDDGPEKGTEDGSRVCPDCRTLLDRGSSPVTAAGPLSVRSRSVARRTVERQQACSTSPMLCVSRTAEFVPKLRTMNASSETTISELSRLKPFVTPAVS